MKVFYSLLFLTSFSIQAQVGIGTTNPSAASMLEINSESSDGSFKGLMPPRVTVNQRDLMKPTDADVGLLVFVNDPNSQIFGLQVWNGTFWENVYLMQNSFQPTEVSYTNTQNSQNEDSGGINLEFNITNPSSTHFLSVTVSASSYDDLVENVSQEITIPSGTSVYNAIGIFNLINDAEVEGNENIIFSITNATGGSGAPTIGEKSVFELTIVDNDVNLWINEIHYDNDGSDKNERVEIAGSAGIDLTGYKIYHYNGRNGEIIKEKSISGNLIEVSNGLGVKNFFIEGLQNDQEGIALVDRSERVIQFLSYEGEVIANEGPAAGMIADLLPVFEESSMLGYSMQLTGTGSAYTDFTWTTAPDTIDLINSGQTFN